MNPKIIRIDYAMRRIKEGENMCDILMKLSGKSAEQLLEENNIDLTKAPIDIKKLVSSLGISVLKKDFSDIEALADAPNGSILGATISNGNELTIFYQSDATYNRMRFTVAHELAHCCLHSENLEMQHVELRLDFGKSYDEHEKEANIFAGALLIPRKLLDQEYKKFIIPSLSALAELFEVSETVMAARLDYLNYSYLKDAQIGRGIE